MTPRIRYFHYVWEALLGSKYRIDIYDIRKLINLIFTAHRPWQRFLWAQQNQWPFLRRHTIRSPWQLCVRVSRKHSIQYWQNLHWRVISFKLIHRWCHPDNHLRSSWKYNIYRIKASQQYSVWFWEQKHWPGHIITSHSEIMHLALQHGVECV